MMNAERDFGRHIYPPVNSVRYRKRYPSAEGVLSVGIAKDGVGRRHAGLRTFSEGEVRGDEKDQGSQDQPAGA